MFKLTTRQAAENKIILKGETRSLIERGLILKDKEKELSLETGWYIKINHKGGQKNVNKGT
jgi:hypothetical protein